ncbi:MAG TPA: hypothetical protein VLC09_14385, partial [Polyangiaceae bacterium]|nr:hypothetical protein [Polyangiaceae bacterium]
DVDHCGACGTACDAGMSCVRGVCLDPCTEGQTLCAFDEPACVDLDVDARNCGRCGHRCGPGTTCQAGKCACDADAPAAAFQADVLPVFESSCGGKSCHSGTNELTSLDLSPAVAYAQLVGVASEGESCTSSRVVAGAPDDSFLVDKLLGGDLCYGKRMPRQDDALGDEAVGRIIGWICAGAADD